MNLGITPLTDEKIITGDMQSIVSKAIENNNLPANGTYIALYKASMRVHLKRYIKNLIKKTFKQIDNKYIDTYFLLRKWTFTQDKYRGNPRQYVYFLVFGINKNAVYSFIEAEYKKELDKVFKSKYTKRWLIKDEVAFESSDTITEYWE